jgi:hypothetical protein
MKEYFAKITCLNLSICRTSNSHTLELVLQVNAFYGTNISLNMNVSDMGSISAFMRKIIEYIYSGTYFIEYLYV